MIFDNFGQELKDYDIVATSGTDYQCNIAIYYKLTLITWQDFDARHRNNSIVTSKKCRVYNTDREQSLVDYTDIMTVAGETISQLNGESDFGCEIFVLRPVRKSTDDEDAGESLQDKILSMVAK